MVVSNLAVCKFYAETLFCALLRYCVCALLRSFACICMFLRPTTFRRTGFGNRRKYGKCSWRSSGELSGPSCLETTHFHVWCPPIVANCSCECCFELSPSKSFFWSLILCQGTESTLAPVQLGLSSPMHMAGDRRKLQEGFKAQESRTLANFHKI